MIRYSVIISISVFALLCYSGAEAKIIAGIKCTKGKKVMTIPEGSRITISTPQTGKIKGVYHVRSKDTIRMENGMLIALSDVDYIHKKRAIPMTLGGTGTVIGGFLVLGGLAALASYPESPGGGASMVFGAAILLPSIALLTQGSKKLTKSDGWEFECYRFNRKELN